jgi:hypothetical protein
MAEIAAIIGIIITIIVEAIIATVFIVTMKGDIRVGAQVSKGLQQQINDINSCVAAYRSKHEEVHSDLDNRTFENQRKISNVEENISFIKAILVEIKASIEDMHK